MTGENWQGAFRKPGDEGGDPAGRKARAPSPNDVADRILEDHRLVCDDTRTVYRYEAGRWRKIEDIHLAQLALESEGGYSQQKRRSEIVNYLQVRSYRAGLTWGRVGAGEIAFANGILDVATRQLRGHAPEHYLERVLPWRWLEDAVCPVWLDLLIDWFGESGGGGEAAALQRFFGYVTLSHARFKKALMLYGVPDSGKSLIMHVMSAMVGPDQCCTLSVENMDDPTRCTVIKGKALNVMTELPAGAMIADSGFKTMVSTEDPILLDEKYKPPERYVPTAKHAIATNTLPRLNDRTSATFNRLLIVPMMRTIAVADQDPELPAALVAEMPGIVRWAAAGARDLVAAAGAWPPVPAAERILAEYRDDINPAGQFLRECCIEQADAAASLEALTKSFNRWNAGSRNQGVKQFGKMLRDAGLEERIKDIRFPYEDGVKGSRTLKGLTGYRLHDHDTPAVLYIDPEAAAGTAETVVGRRHRTDPDPPADL